MLARWLIFCTLVCLATSARADVPPGYYGSSRPPPATHPDTDPAPTPGDEPRDTPWFIMGNLIVLLGAAYALLRPRRDPVLEKWGLS